MKFNARFAVLLLTLPLLALGCVVDDDADIDPINLFSIQLNNAELRDGAEDLPVAVEIGITFSRALDPTLFEAAFSLTSANDNPTPDFSYTNQSSGAIISANLAFETTYTLRILSAPIAEDGGQLSNEVSLSFMTTADGSITSLPPCTSATQNCLRTSSFMGSTGGDFQFYASFPIYEDLARWEEITAAIIVVHGVNRNGDDYFNYLMNALRSAGLEDSVLVIAPIFKNAGEAAANELFWSGSSWREGSNAAAGSAVSSFSVVDQLLTQLGDQAHFPVLEKVMVTGHSSGALFTHLYAAANQVEEALPALSFDYLVANSQYLYYPDGRRLNGNSDQLFTPTNCTGYDIWPLGYSVVPPYLENTNSTTFNERFLARDVTYLLGNGNQADPSLNTMDCSATLLGPTRFARGEQMFRYLELAYPGQEVHEKVIVDGIGHDGQGMYSSSTFRQRLNNFGGR
ncbi:MAG: hypothetical protein ACI81P_002992 [Neolewinella sp.]|jgi:hypothetical protein